MCKLTGANEKQGGAEGQKRQGRERQATRREEKSTPEATQRSPEEAEKEALRGQESRPGGRQSNRLGSDAPGVPAEDGPSASLPQEHTQGLSMAPQLQGRLTTTELRNVMGQSFECAEGGHDPPAGMLRGEGHEGEPLSLAVRRSVEVGALGLLVGSSSNARITGRLGNNVMPLGRGNGNVKAAGAPLFQRRT